ncbi:MAG TPA: hypothetical protein DCO79_12245 [Spirochaeta sp.]|nr:hypothetical protein [Spirochaeta sp.]
MNACSDKKPRRLILILLFSTVIFPFILTAEGITILRHNNRTELLIDTAGILKPENSYIELEIAGEGTIELNNGQESKILRFSAGKKAEKIYLHTDLTRIFPESISITETNKDFDILSARIIYEQQPSSVHPADIGHIIFSNFAENNPEGWNVYSWNLIPEVLIFDTVDYVVQSRLFKRLAFFVEKPGYTGRLVPNEELEGKHGWNAHDYRPEDLAEFFNMAEKTVFPLNREELVLRTLLLDHGIIKTADSKGGFEAGRGAVLSVSRETLPNWRYRFLTHECLHGIFFTDSVYRDEMREAFAELKPEEVEFWKHLLDYRRYDVDNSYLLVNEFMAYSLQQPVEEIDEYFKGFLYKRMIAARPYESDFVENFDRNFPDSFTSAVTKIEKILYSHTGRISGHLANLYPAEVESSFFDLFPRI